MSKLHEFLTTTQTLRDLWDEQADFNRHFRQLPAATFEARTRETKEIVLHMISECSSLLDASGAWKSHRRVAVRENPLHVKVELVDILKYWITVCQIHGFTPEAMVDAFWEKSMVVRQRYSQEFVQSVDQPSVVIDIDNVLADYIRGFTTWLRDNEYMAAGLADRIIAERRYLRHQDLGLSAFLYEDMKHLYRVSGEHATLPVMPGVSEFMQWVTEHGWAIILLTSRPIDQYPNLYGETLRWLETNTIPYQMVWWAANKGTAIIEAKISQHIRFAVDDEFQYANQFHAEGIRTYWLTGEGERHDKNFVIVKTLADIIREESARE